MRKPLALALLGVVLLAAGAWFALRPRRFGWTAYTPLSDATFSPGVLVLDGTGILALLAAAAGLALLAGTGGYLLAARRR
ncbi:hypothetical protein [Georgenia muralis]|uniref:hypothetical protein n=1 Tax=Georgenia muralis TaxID=154117 RepID=UPI000F5063A8|nr:hypothetical protein [Georgenia muralis]